MALLTIRDISSAIPKRPQVNPMTIPKRGWSFAQEIM